MELVLDDRLETDFEDQTQAKSVRVQVECFEVESLLQG